MDNRFDIVIVGGGPAGAACGTLLARAGLRVLICERAQFPREKICGECVNPRAWRYFEQLGIAERLRELHPRRIESFRVSAVNGRSVAGNIPTTADEPFFSIPRSTLDSLLLANARAWGATVLENTTVTTLRRTTDWEVTTLAGESFRARVLIGADGRNSIVARHLCRRSPRSPHWSSRTSNGEVRVGVQWHTVYQPHCGSAVELFLFNSGYGGVVNIDGNRANIALITRAEIARRARSDFPLFLAATLFSNPSARQRLVLPFPLSEIKTAFPMTPRVHHVRHSHAELVGDARQTVEPFTGEGILFALQDAFVVAQRLLIRFGKNPLPSASSHTRAIANVVISPVLQNSMMANLLVRLSSNVPYVAKPFLRQLFPIS